MVLFILVAAGVGLGLVGRGYAHCIARWIGEDATRPTPALERNDGRDYVPTPTPVVFAHHFASIAGAGPIVGPVIAVIYGWAPALLWVLLGGVLIGGVHDYLATYMATREGGQSIATVVRRMIGRDAFVAVTLFLVVVLALVCAAFLNLSATALTSMLPFERLDLSRDQTLFRVVATPRGEQVVIGGIASMSVIVITAVAPLLGWMYLKKRVPVWICSVAAIVTCAASITIGVFRPVAFPAEMQLFGLTLHGQDLWVLLLSAYVLVAAGVPVWIFLQSRDFINVHILYAGMAGLLVTLVVAGLRGAPPAEPLPAFNVIQGEAVAGSFWPMLFILIACGAVSGFHSLCAGGTTCKQLTSEVAARRIGFYGMLLETFLAVCVIAVLMTGAGWRGYLADVHPQVVQLDRASNPVLGFAMAVGTATNLAFGVPIAAGALAGMVLLEGFLVTTLDTAVRLMRYLFEEIWRSLFGGFDVFAAPAGARAAAEWDRREESPAGADGIPAIPDPAAEATLRPAHLRPTPRALRPLLVLLRQYWFNSALAVAVTLVFAYSGGIKALWGIFATANQLLAALVLGLAAAWLSRRGRRAWFALLPALFMLTTTVASLFLMLDKFLDDPWGKAPLLVADIALLVIVSYLVIAFASHPGEPTPAEGPPPR